MTEYKNGKIYKMYNKNDESVCYVGSTFKTLKKRLKMHSTMWKYHLRHIKNPDKKCLYYSCFSLFDPNDTELKDIVIQLLYSQRCNKKTLKKIESKFIQINDTCINIHRPRREVDLANFTLFSN